MLNRSERSVNHQLLQKIARGFNQHWIRFHLAKFSFEKKSQIVKICEKN